MENTSFYIPTDRRRAMLHKQRLAQFSTGTVLFADISGFTPLTNALVAEFGARRGADELTRQLNTVYNVLIAAVDRFDGSVINFSGDAITCWFGAESGATAPLGEALATAEQLSVTSILRAIASALAMQQAMQEFAQLALEGNLHVNLAIKTAIAAGTVQRMLVGNADIQLIDVLAGATLDRVAATEQMAQKGEVLLDQETLAHIHPWVTVGVWRTNPVTQLRYATVTTLQQAIEPVAVNTLDLGLPEADVKPWVLPAVYSRFLSEQGRFLAELRPATALFLRFEGLDYDQDREAGRKLDRYVCWVQKLITRYEGSLIQLTTGDKGSYLYAAFGAPIAHDDDSTRAVAAALELRTAPPEFSFITAVQIGISQGLMRVGAYGSDTRRTYGVLGEETNIAARLMTQAKPGQVLISQVVADAVADDYQLLSLGLIRLKGKPEPQPIHAVLGARPRTDERLTKLYATPLVGREPELARLLQALEAGLAGQGQIVRIEGSAGVGKSHLTANFIEQARARGLEIAVAACQSTSQDIAYFAGRQIARVLFGLATPAPQSELAQIAQIEAAINLMNPSWLLRMPLLGELVGLPIPDNPTTAAFDPRLRQEALISLAIEIVQTRARQQTLLLLFEDIHWIDEASQGILLALSRVITSAPILLMFVHRPPTRDNDPFLTEIAALPNQTHLILEELSPVGVAALAYNRLGGAISPLALSLIQAQAQGNPFFTEELIDALIDANHLISVENSWTLAPALVNTLRDTDCLSQIDGEWRVPPDAPLAAVELGIPTTIHGIVLARLDRLPEPVKLTMKVASVIGRVFTYELLEKAHPVQRDIALLAQQMETLLRRDFARIERPAPQLSYIFKHNITQEVVYQTLLEDQLHELHRAVATVLEELQPDKIEDLAFHFYNADLRRWDVRRKALQYLEVAGNRAQHDYANETALNYFNRALLLDQRWSWLRAKIEILHILGRRDEERSTLEQLAQVPDASEFEAALLWGDYHEAISDYTQAQSVIQWSLTLAQTGSDLAGEARCFARLGMIAWRQGDYEAAGQAYQAALGVIQAGEQFREEEAEARYGLGLVYRQQGKYDEAKVQFERDLALNRQQANRQNEAKALNALGHVELLRRNYHKAISYYQESLAIRQAIGDRAGVGASLLSLAQGLGYIGDHSQAEPMLHEALKIHQVMNSRWWETLIWNELGILYFMVGNLEKAQECLNHGLSLSKAIGDEARQAYILCNLGQVLRDQNNLAGAEEILTNGLFIAQTQGDVNLEAIYLSDLAMVSMRAKRFDEAIQRANDSLKKFTTLDLVLSTTTNLTTLAAAHLALGDQAQALDYAHQALNILDECHGEGPDFPHRDYWTCFEVLQTMGETVRAQQALQAAHHLLMAQAGKISDAAMRQSYLENIAYNLEIVRTMQSDDLAA
ncbi:MAG: tetratricopeptide repeat protein [Chloroflexi bacterium]|nr:tetratricopeptide repeat protein [Chloroflexota bacterium]